MQQIGSYLSDDSVGIIGIYGMGGVGKTTLLEMINNKFPEIGAPGFEVVIWVTVSKDANIRKIQKSIGDRLQLSPSAEDQEPASSSPQVEEQAEAIFKALSKRRFLLLLDDVWEELDLKLVGVPLPTAENKCKIILTTRSKQVCHKMGARKLVNVEALNQSDSWELFKMKAGTEVDLDNPRIKPIAEAVARKCGGLPLALITVGCAMAEAHSVGEWQEALDQLRESPHELPGMKEEVLSLIKFSFDRLGDETIKECLLYCCLFPEDEEIPVEQVIGYWLWEGFLDNPQSNSIIRARNRGHGVITRLKSAGLLLEIESAGLLFEIGRGSYVKLHDVVREMCLWLTGAENDKSTFLVYAGRNDLLRFMWFGLKFCECLCLGELVPHMGLSHIGESKSNFYFIRVSFWLGV
uniref:Putative disease resistance protein At1g61300 n=1 Tax=Anthurium amnicola TaxID=1678845 RepID=A0A1D1Y9Q9_9ARAE